MYLHKLVIKYYVLRNPSSLNCPSSSPNEMEMTPSLAKITTRNTTGISTSRIIVIGISLAASGATVKYARAFNSYTVYSILNHAIFQKEGFWPIPLKRIEAQSPASGVSLLDVNHICFSSVPLSDKGALYNKREQTSKFHLHSRYLPISPST